MRFWRISAGEPRECATVKAPAPEEEDRRRPCRERRVLTNERVIHVNKIKGLLFSQGVAGYEPARRDRELKGRAFGRTTNYAKTRGDVAPH